MTHQAGYKAARNPLRVSQQVRFDEHDEAGEFTDSLGVVSRVWTNGKYVTVISDGRTFVRCIEAVTPCV